MGAMGKPGIALGGCYCCVPLSHLDAGSSAGKHFPHETLPGLK